MKDDRSIIFYPPIVVLLDNHNIVFSANSAFFLSFFIKILIKCNILEYIGYISTERDEAMYTYPILEYIFSPLILDHNIDYKNILFLDKAIHYSEMKLQSHYTRNIEEKKKFQTKKYLL